MEDKLKQIKKSDDLSDIVLEKKSSNLSGPEKTKKLLLTAATLVLLFLIALVIMKLINNPNDKSQGNIAQIGDGITKKTDAAIEGISKKVEETNSLFQQEPIIDETSQTDLKFEEMVRKLKAQDSAEETPVEKAQESVKKSIDENIKKLKQPKEDFSHKADKLAKEIIKQKETIKDKAVKTVTEKKEEIKKAASKIVPETKKTTPIKETKPVKKEVVLSTVIDKTPQNTKLSTLSGYFIQVGATANIFPDRRYLKKIKNAGFDYVVHSMTINGKKIKKILIGPYASKNAAKMKLPSVKEKINPGAYIYRIK